MLQTFFLEAQDLDLFLKEGKSLGKSSKQRVLSDEELNDLTPQELRGQDFDGEKIRKEMVKTQHMKSEKHVQSMDPAITAILESADFSLKNPSSNLTAANEWLDSIEKCFYERVMTPVTLQHTLRVNIKNCPHERLKIKICKGHKDKKKSENPEKDKAKRKKQLSEDPTIKSFKVWIDKQGFLHRDYVRSEWQHIDNTSTCNSFHEIEGESLPEKKEEEDIWQIDNPELLDSLDCTVVSIENGPPETRIIEGHEVFRPYWSKVHRLQCSITKEKNCEFLKNKNCILISEKCLKESHHQCVEWEKNFKCQTKRQVQFGQDLKSIYGTDQNLWETNYLPNTEFSDVTIKLTVFDEMKKELQNSNIVDVRSVLLFSGNHQQCSKSITEEIMYDCCSSMDGLATKMKLSKCTSDEIALAESRSKGLCHYLGKKKEKFLGLWVSRKEHVFCVFPSKLARVFQEAARKQLNIDWGDAEKPNCRGLTQEEIKQLDFTKLDLREAFELPKDIDHQEKIKNVEERLKQRIQEAS